METEPRLAAWAVGVGLAVWSACALALVRDAEQRLAGAGSRLPLPWFEAVAGLALCTATPLLHPTHDVAQGVACIALCAAAPADARTGYLFDAVTFPAAVLSAGAAVAAGHAATAAGGVLALAGPFGAVVGLSRGAWMGLGDVKAIFALGAAFGALEGALAILAACLSGIIATAFARRGTPPGIAFGPHLAAGATFALLAGEPLAHRISGFGS